MRRGALFSSARVSAYWHRQTSTESSALFRPCDSKCFRKNSKIEVGAVESCCNLLVWKDSRLTPLTDFSVVPDGTVCFLVHMTQQNENDLNCFWKLSGNFLYWIFNIITLTGFFLILKLSGKDLPIKLNKIIIQVSCLMSHNKNFFFCKSHLVNCTDYCT